MLCPICDLPVRCIEHSPGTAVFTYAHFNGSESHGVQFTSEARAYDYLMGGAIAEGSTPPPVRVLRVTCTCGAEMPLGEWGQHARQAHPAEGEAPMTPESGPGLVARKDLASRRRR